MRPSDPNAFPFIGERGGPPAFHQLNVRAAFLIFAACLSIFAAISVFEVLTGPLPWSEYRGGAALARSFATTVSRAYNVILGMVVSAIAIAIPITANMYTPKLVEIFVRDRTSVGVLTFFVFSCMHAVYATFMTWEGPPGSLGVWPRVHAYAILAEMLFGFSILVPFLHYVSGFLNPSIIIRRVTSLITDEMDEILRGRWPVRVAQKRLAQKVLHLGNVILRAIDRADRDVALEAIGALKAVVSRYHSIETRFPAEWFEVDEEIMIGFTPDAVAFVNRDRDWVEHRCMTQLSLAYNSALTKMPDAVSAIAVAARDVALAAERAGDWPVVQLCVRFFNTFIREAVKKKDVHAIYDIFSHYKALAGALMDMHPDLLSEAGRYFKYYAEFARATGMPFIYDLASYELGEMVERAYERGVPTRAGLLETMLSLDGTGASARLIKSRAILWSFFAARKLAAEADRVRASLAGVPAAVLEAARAELLGTTERIFWEVTDRQSNFDYVDDARKALVRELLDGLLREQAPPAPRPHPAKSAA